MYKDLELHGLTADLVSFNACISVCGRAAQWQRGLDLLHSAKNLLKLNVITYSAATV